MKIVIAEDRALLREGLRLLLSSRGHEIVAEATDGLEAVRVVGDHRPDAVVLSVDLPPFGLGEAARRMTAEWPALNVIALSKTSTSFHLLEALKEPRSAARAPSTGSVPSGIEADSRIEPMNLTRKGVLKPRGSLSSREREVLAFVAGGFSSKEIAARLSLAVPTVETHRRQITNKLGVRSVAGLTKYAIRAGLTTIDP
jgi:DNA-binding NarL/FixJ family response regulator